jgi:hypothetical protein
MSDLSTLAAGSALDLLIAETQGLVKVTRLPQRKAKRSELVMSSTKGVRTNTNRRGQAYNGQATRAQISVIEGNGAAYFKTSG